jgi:hypothetical protein
MSRFDEIRKHHCADGVSEKLCIHVRCGPALQNEISAEADVGCCQPESDGWRIPKSDYAVCQTLASCGHSRNDGQMLQASTNLLVYCLPSRQYGDDHIPCFAIVLFGDADFIELTTSSVGRSCKY